MNTPAWCRILVIALAVPSFGTAQSQASVSIERAAVNRWRATYHLPETVRALRFDRPAAFFRERVFKVVTAGYRFGRRDAWQLVALDSGATPRNEITLEFSEFTDPLPKEYELFQPFTDGAVALYTGHFLAVAENVAGDSTAVRTLRVAPPLGMHAVVQGRIERGEVTITDSPRDGTYIYMGTATPIETRDVVAVVDPGMPAWLREMFDRRLPELFGEYARRFGVALPWKPVVLFSYEDNGAPGLSSGGGTLTGFINMTLAGNGWRAQNADAAERAFELIAHESAHLWNGQLAHNVNGTAGAWMHEGGADAIAVEMMRAFGVIDSARYAHRRSEGLNRCVNAVRTASVETSLARGYTRTPYDCGFVIAMWSTAAARRSQRDADLFTFWRTLIANATRNGGSYDDSTYFATLRSFGVADSLVARMRAFLAHRDSASIAIAGLRDAGLNVRAARGQPPPTYQQDVARTAMIHIMQQACARVTFNFGTPIRTGAVPGCEPFANDLQVFQIQRVKIGDGAALYDAVRAACAASTIVTLHGEDGRVISSVPCTRALAPRPEWYEID